MAETCQHKDAVYEVLSFLNQQENVQTYIDDQRALPCSKGDYDLDPLFEDIQTFLDEGQVLDYLDHSYQSSMACDAQLQTMLLNGDIDAFLEKWDTDWQHYNRTVIRKVQEYESQQ